MKLIEIDDIVGHAFLIYFRKTGKRSLSLSKIGKFANKVVDDLKAEGEKVYLSLSRNQTRSFFNTTKYFEYDEDTNIVKLNPYVTEDDLIKRFCGYIDWKILIAFRKEENTKLLFEEM